MAPKSQEQRSSAPQRSGPQSSTSAQATKALAFLRMAFGVTGLIAPQFSCAMFGFPIPPSFSVIVRLFAGRDLALGQLLFSAGDASSADAGSKEIKRALWAGLVADGLDVATALFEVGTGNMEVVPAAALGGVGVVFLGLGMLGLRGV